MDISCQNQYFLGTMSPRPRGKKQPVRNDPMRILNGTLRFEDGIKTCAKLEEG